VYVDPLETGRVNLLESGRVNLVAIAPLDRIDAAVGGYRELAELLTLFGGGVALLAGWLLAGRALRPVARLTETARSIGRSRHLGERVPVPPHQDEMGRMATTFNEMLESVEEAYGLQQRFVADASHELRAPLTAIQGNLELLERQDSLPETERAEAVDQASREARRMAALVSDLLSLARADSGLVLAKERVELDRVLLEAVSDARHLARGQELQVGELEPAVVIGNPDRLKQLFLILIDNALKYTPSHGSVTLGIHRSPGEVVVTVRDTGIGISHDDLSRVFERFYRADPARSRDPGGTGLGLPIAKWIVEQHDGKIVAASTPGMGTTVTISIPVSE
jgi:signal transduction histidine kinase